MTKDQKKKASALFREQVAQVSAQLQPLLDQINGLTRSQRILAVVLTIGLLCGGFFYFFYMPKMQILAKLGEDIRKADGNIQAAQKELRQLKPLQEKKAEKELAFKEAMRALPESREIPMFLASISASGREAGLDFLLFKPEAEARRDFYAEIPVSVEMQGGFHETVTFLDFLARMHRVVNVRNVDMQVQRGKDGAGMLRTRCQIVTYRFVEPEIQPPAKGGRKK